VLALASRVGRALGNQIRFLGPMRPARVCARKGENRTEAKAQGSIAGPLCQGASSLTDLRNAARLVVRTSSPVEQPSADRSAGNPPAPALPTPEQTNPPPSKVSSGTPLMIMRDVRRKALRCAKPASALRPGDTVRLKSGKRVVITYVSRGFTPTDRYIEWRGPEPNNWANVPLDTPVRPAWRLPRVWTPRIQ
jgi:hypothetical protein